jgi:hypothetical protein
MLNGDQYVVIVCGGSKNDTPSGSTIVAFALPLADRTRGSVCPQADPRQSG